MEEPEILIVDDYPDTVHLLARIFASAGLKTECADSGKEALEKLSRKRFRFLLTDYQMPGMDGVELAARAKKMIPDLKVVLTSSDLPPEARNRAMAIGISVILEKPFPVETVRTLARRWKGGLDQGGV